jgi:hypothetical protein
MIPFYNWKRRIPSSHLSRPTHRAAGKLPSVTQYGSVGQGTDGDVISVKAAHLLRNPIYSVYHTHKSITMDVHASINPTDLFSAKGLVVVITGGGSGTSVKPQVTPPCPAPQHRDVHTALYISN